MPPYLLSLMLCCSAVPAEPPPTQLTVRVYDYAEVGARDLARAREAARLPFTHAGIDLRWWNCGAPPLVEAPDPQCHGAVLAEHLQVNIVPDNAGIPARRDKLGLTLLTRGEHVNGRAYVFADRVRALSRQVSSRRVMGDLLGYSVAHEVGHLLLGGTHSAGGLMRRTWSVAQLQSAFAHILWFHPREGARMRARLIRGQATQPRNSDLEEAADSRLCSLSPQ